MTEDTEETKEIDDLLHHSIKCKLKSILKFPDMLPLIINKVDAVNKIWTEAYFMFNQLVLYSLKDDKDISFDATTLMRCILFVTEESKNIRKDDTIQEIDNKIKKTVDDKIKRKLLADKIQAEHLIALKHIYDNVYKPLGDNELAQFKNIPAITRPLEYLSKQIFTNIKNHVAMNFYRFQKLYIRNKVIKQLTDLHIAKPIIHATVNCIMFHINNVHTNLVIKSKLIKQFKNKSPDGFNKLAKIMMDVIKTETKFVPEKIRHKITDFNMRANYDSVLKYYYHMIKYLEEKNIKRFSLLPQLSLKYSYIKFDSRFISTIYDEWIQLKLDEIPDSDEDTVKKKYGIKFKLKKVGIKLFEKNYLKFYNRCFNVSDMVKHKTNKYHPISFSTNGYCVSILFRMKIKKSIVVTKGLKKKVIKKESSKVNLSDYQKEKKFKRGLFDADNTSAPEEFFDNYHLIGIDPNNDVILSCRSETGKKLDITKNYYNDISHITKNTKKMKKYVKTSSIKEIYAKMSDTNYKKTINILEYNKYIKLYRENKETIYNFYTQNKVQALELDTYINKQKAIHNIVRKLVPKNGEEIKFNSSKNPHIDEELYEIKKHLPPLIAFGKGNGNITINNLKNKGPKGPIKTLAMELSKYCLTILTDEYNTSQICSYCTDEILVHPMEKVNKTKYYKDEKGKRCKKQIEIVRENYKLCYCKLNNNDHEIINGIHKIWNRDYNSAGNILHVMRLKLQDKPLKLYTRKKLSKKSQKDNIIISYSQEWEESNECVPNKKVSRKTKTLNNKSTNHKSLIKKHKQQLKTATIKGNPLKSNPIKKSLTDKNNNG